MLSFWLLIIHLISASNGVTLWLNNAVNNQGILITLNIMMSLPTPAAPISCLILSNYQFTRFNGEWQYIGEYNGKPAYILNNGDTYYLEWVSGWNRYGLHDAPQGETAIYGYCNQNDINDCIAGTWYHTANGGGFATDSNAAIDPCPTTAPTKAPTTTTEPTTIEPTNYPTSTPIEPTIHPTLHPSEAATIDPTTAPTKPSTLNPTNRQSTKIPTPSPIITNEPTKTPTGSDQQVIDPTASPTNVPTVNISVGNTDEIVPGGFGIVDMMIILGCLCCLIICCYVVFKKHSLRGKRKGTATFTHGEIEMESPVPKHTNFTNNTVNVTIGDDSSSNSNAPPPPPAPAGTHKKQSSEDSLDHLQHRFLSEEFNEAEKGATTTPQAPSNMSFASSAIKRTLPSSPEQTPPPPPPPIIEGQEDSDDSLYRKQHAFLQEEVNENEDEEEEENNLKVIRQLNGQNTPQTPGGDSEDDYSQ